MYQPSKFEWKDGKPDQEQVEEWAETFFYSMMNLLNAFFCHVDIKEAADRLGSIPFDELTVQQLEGEKQVVIDMAVARVQELAEAELLYMQAYGEQNS
ncbi:hypothetical protein [Syntrophomonas erecta]